MAAKPVRGGLTTATPAHAASSLTGVRQKPTFIDDAVVVAAGAGTAAFLATRSPGAGLAWSAAGLGLGGLMYVGAGQTELQSLGGGILATSGAFLLLRLLGDAK